MSDDREDLDQRKDVEEDTMRDSDEASRALEWVQQILAQDEERHRNVQLERSDKDDEALPISPEAALELREVIDSLHPADIAWVLEALPLDERLAVWNLVESESDGEVLVEVNDGVRETSPWIAMSWSTRWKPSILTKSRTWSMICRQT